MEKRRRKKRKSLGKKEENRKCSEKRRRRARSFSTDFLEAERSFSSVPFVASNVSLNPDRVFKNRTSFNEPVDSSLPLQGENFILHFA